MTFEETDSGTTERDVVFSKPKTRIEKLGELYDAAIENVKKRLDTNETIREHGLNAATNLAHEWDMQVITTYLQETKRPEWGSVNVPPANAEGQIPKLFMETEEGTFTLSENAQWMFVPRP